MRFKIIFLTFLLAANLCYGADEAEFKTPEFNAQWGLNYINAAKAYALGFTGEGVVITVIDSGINPNHPELFGKISSQSYDFINNTSVMTDPYPVPNGHGTGVASVIAANKDELNTHGVAFNSTILAFRALGSASSNLPAAQTAFINSSISKVANQSLGLAVKVNNVPTGVAIAGKPGDFNSISPAERARVQNLINTTYASLFAPLKSLDAADKIIVHSAGNDALGQLPLDKALPLFSGYENLIGNWLVVVAVDSNGNLANYSNACGAAYEFCLAAPGNNALLASGQSTGMYTGSGTSFAAPMVAGALALVQEAFPYMTAPQLTETILTTAVQHKNSNYQVPSTHSGNFAGETYAYQYIFGQGLLDAGSAVLGPSELRMDWVLDTQIYDSVFGNDISGAYGITKNGASTLVLTGANTYTGATIVNNGGFEVRGSLASPVTVNANGMLGGSGAITGTINNYGLIYNGRYDKISSSYLPSTLTLGSVTNQNGGVLGFSIDKNNPVTAFTIQNLNVLGGLLAPKTLFVEEDGVYIVLTVANNMTFANINQFLSFDWSSLPYVDAEFVVNGKTIELHVSGTNYVGDGGALSLNGKAISDIFDLLYMESDAATQAKLTPVYSMTDGERTKILETMTANQISGAAMLNANIETINQFLLRLPADAVETRDSLTAGSFLWLQPFGGYARQKRNGSLGTDAYDGIQGGLAAGYENGGDSSLTWGIAAAAGFGNFEQNTGTKKSFNDYRLAFYQKADLDAVILKGAVSAGYESYSSSRKIALADKKASADYDGYSANIEADLLFKTDYEFLLPFIGASFTYMRENSYSESGADIFNLDVAAANTSMLSAKLGVEAALFKSRGTNISAQAYYRRLLTNNELTKQTSFSSPAIDYTFETYEAPLDKDAGVLGLQCRYALGESTYLYANLLGQIGQNSIYGAASIGLSFAFDAFSGGGKETAPKTQTQPIERAAPQPVAMPVPQPKMTVKTVQSVEIGPGYFASGVTQLGPRLREYLSVKAAEFKKTGFNMIYINGHSDSVEANGQALSEARAKAAAEYLRSLGIDGSKIMFRGKGALEPAQSNANEAGRKMNRRVEFEVR